MHVKVWAGTGSYIQVPVAVLGLTMCSDACEEWAGTGSISNFQVSAAVLDLTL